MKILYIGGVYHCEYSLWHEQNNNPNLKVVFCRYMKRGGIYSSIGYDTMVNPYDFSTRNDIDFHIKNHKPDMIVFRNFIPSEYFANVYEILWIQEMNPLTETNQRYNRIEGAGTFKKCYGSSFDAIKKNGYWMPYCVSKFHEKYNPKKTMSVLMETVLPPSNLIGQNKIKSLEILLIPLLQTMPGMVWFHLKDLQGWMNNLGIVQKYIKPWHNPLVTAEYVAQAKIYLSPTSIWYDEGWISHKTIQAMGCGSLVLTNNYPGMENLLGKDGENVIYSNDPKETVDKVKYYLDHESEREKIALRGMEFAHNEFNWEKRLTGMYKYFYGKG